MNTYREAVFRAVGRHCGVDLMAWEAGAGARAPEKALDDMRSALRRVRGEIEKLKTSAARLLDLPSFGEDANNPVLSDLISAAWHLQAAQGRLEMP